MIYYIDIGSYVGIIAEQIILTIQQFDDYQVFLFEPCKAYLKELRKKFKHSDVKIVPKAISSTRKKQKLYHAFGACGHSLISTKYNINLASHETVSCEIFSRWYDRHIKKDQSDIVLLRSDIEGSEFDLYEDLIKSGVYKEIDIYAGSLADIYKINASTNKINKFKNTLKQHNINVISINSHDYIDGINKIETKIKQLKEMT